MSAVTNTLYDAELTKLLSTKNAYLILGGYTKLRPRCTMEDTLVGDNPRGTVKGAAKTLSALIQERQEIMDKDDDELAPFSFS
jgi:hypothetical protein